MANLRDNLTKDGHETRRGVMFWLAFCIVAVVVRGVRWDETFEYAQIMTRVLPYPSGHPMFIYIRGAYCLQNYFSAFMLQIGFGPVWICGLRNVLFIAASVIPVFLLTTALSRKAVWGHVAALLTLEGIYLEFDGSYPIAIWPELYSNGIIGTGYALFALYFLITNRWAIAFFLIGLMPCIHIGQAPPLFAMAVLCTAWFAVTRQRANLQQAAMGSALGLALSGGFWIVQRLVFAVPLPASGPYYSPDNPVIIWRSYTALHDIHRQFPPGNGHIVLVGMLLIGSLAALWESRQTIREQEDRRPYLGVLAYGVCVAGLIWALMLIHAAMGNRMPFILIGWMPYRLINHVAPLLLAVAVSLLPRKNLSTPAALFLFGALCYFLVLPYAPMLVGDRFFARYVARGDGLFFALGGAAMTALALELKSSHHFPRTWGVLAFGALVGLGAYHHFGAACLLGGAIAWFILERIHSSISWRHARTALACICVCLVLSMLGHQAYGRKQLPIGDFDRQVADCLRDQPPPHAMIAGPPDEFMLQARTGHPVFAEIASMSYSTYMIELGPSFQKILWDVYGTRFDQLDPAAPKTPPRPWRDIWRERTREQWQALARDYSFDYVLTFGGLTLDLPVMIQHGTSVLYRIPPPQ